MNRVVAQMFIILYFLTSTEAYQLLKIPVILQHFREHQQEDRSISFFKFLDIHYMHGSPMDDDYDRDMQLPFKKATHHLNNLPVPIPELVRTTTQTLSLKIPRDFISRNDSRTHAEYAIPIFQPPKC